MHPSAILVILEVPPRATWHLASSGERDGKCRVSEAKVVAIWSLPRAIAQTRAEFKEAWRKRHRLGEAYSHFTRQGTSGRFAPSLRLAYRVGETVKPHRFNPCNLDCAAGLHGYRSAYWAWKNNWV